MPNIRAQKLERFKHKEEIADGAMGRLDELLKREQVKARDDLHQRQQAKRNAFIKQAGEKVQRRQTEKWYVFNVQGVFSDSFL